MLGFLIRVRVWSKGQGEVLESDVRVRCEGLVLGLGVRVWC